MVDPDGVEYGRIELRRVADGARYKALRDGEILGWASSLRVACERVHTAYLRSHGPQGGAAADWGRAPAR
jgi:hypothetical protein